MKIASIFESFLLLTMIHLPMLTPPSDPSRDIFPEDVIGSMISLTNATVDDLASVRPSANDDFPGMDFPFEPPAFQGVTTAETTFTIADPIGMNYPLFQTCVQVFDSIISTRLFYKAPTLCWFLPSAMCPLREFFGRTTDIYMVVDFLPC